MSHIVTVKTEIRDTAAVAAACRRLGLSQPSRGTTRLFSGEATGLIVQLPDWRYPIVCNTADGENALQQITTGQGQFNNTVKVAILRSRID